MQIELVMLPTKKRRSTIWRTINVEPNQSNKDEGLSVNPDKDPWSLESGSIGFSLYESLKPKVKRARTFTGQIFMSAAGRPKQSAGRDRLLLIGVGLFIAADLILLYLFLKTFF